MGTGIATEPAPRGTNDRSQADARRRRFVGAVVIPLAGLIAVASILLVSSGGTDSSSGQPQAIPRSQATAPSASQATTAPPSPSTAPPATTAGPTTGMHVVFSDTFDGPSLDPTKWSTCYPWADTGRGCTNFGNAELQWYLPSQAQVADGTARLVASKVPTAGTTRDQRPKTYPWRSGMLTTFKSAVFTYGYVEVVARPPKGDGLWSTIWLLPHDQTWPPELDIAEVYGAYPDHVTYAYHGASGNRPFFNNGTSDLTTGWHTYGMDWEPGSLTWYFDGKRVYHYDGPTPNEPMYFLATLAFAHVLGGDPKAETSADSSLDLRQVTIYQR